MSLLYFAVCRVIGERGFAGPRAGIAQLKRLSRKDPLAKGILGICYLEGLGGKKNPEKGFSLCNQAADAIGCHQLDAKLSECYAQGIGVSTDRKEADRLRRTAAIRGNEALVMWVACELEGGTDDEALRALRLFRWAAQWELPHGRERLLALCHKRMDLATGSVGYKLALEGRAYEQLKIARFWRNDPDVSDPEEARKWYGAAALHNAEGALELAKLYWEGTPWGKDPGLAWWYLKQANGKEEADTLRRQLEREADENLERDGFFQTPAQKALQAERCMATDPQKAKALLEEGVAANSICALERLGIACFTGQLGEKDEQKAFALLKRAWEHSRFSAGKDQIGAGSRLTGIYYAYCLYFGIGTQVCWALAGKVLEQALGADLQMEGPAVSGERAKRTMQQLYQTQVRDFLRHQLPNCSKEMALGIYLLGRFHEDGGRQQFAYPCFERAAEFGVARAHYDLALYAEQGVQRPLEQVFEGGFIPGQTIRLTDTPEELFAHYKLAYEGGVQEACYGLGRCYLKETGTAINRIEGLRLMRRAAENGDQRAWESLGDHYGAEGSIQEAAACYEKAFAAGMNVGEKLLECLREEPKPDLSEPSVCAWLGCRYYEEENYPEAVKWLQKGAGEANPLAASRLADCYGTGKGTAQNLPESLRLHSVAAKKGIADSCYALGRAYYYAEGVEKNFSWAAKLFRQAAEQGHTQAQLMWGICCHNGEGVTKDPEEAFKWYQKAAQKGNLSAKRNIGVLYEFGFGVPRDWNEAMAWYRRAEKEGHPAVREDMARLEKKQEESRKAKTVPRPVSDPPMYDTPSAVAPVYDVPFSNYTNPYESLDPDSTIRSVNRWLKDDLALSSSEEERRNVLSRYQSNYPDIPLYEGDAPYMSPEPLDDHDYLSYLNDIM